MIDPAKLKRYSILAIKVLIAVEILSAIADGASTGNWMRLGFDLVVAGVIYLMWGKLKVAVEQKRREAKERVELSGEDLRVWDALAFSLLWSEEIYASVPVDRRRFVVISVTLIAFGILVGFVQIAGDGIMQLVVSAALVLAAVNLLVWVVSTERGEKESLQTELTLAREVQHSLMPKSDPVVPGLDVAGRSVSASEVGGDHYAYGDTGEEEGSLPVAVFDVSGKGMHAAMSAVFISGAFTAEMESFRSPASVLTKLNKSFYAHSRRGNFASFLLAAVDAKKKKVVFANAGQVKPLMLRAGRTEWLDGSGVNFPLGMVEDARYKNKMVRFAPGDTLFLMTDGITEAMNDRKDLFGEDRLTELIAGLDVASLSSGEIIEIISERLNGHMNGTPQHDDMTLVVIKRI
ncbi:MAG: PP2C family protein-serine/threonine phosphatase [Ignavibacteria bacterium]|nr:PP2C family protein-serine/threonine phosphatase [Ignavibacteria bacterium]